MGRVFWGLSVRCQTHGGEDSQAENPPADPPGIATTLEKWFIPV